MGIFDKLTKKPSSPPPSYNTQQHPNTNTFAAGNTNPYPANSAQNTVSAPTDPNLAGGGMGDKDERALPPGWEKQWHDGYARYFYINTRDPSGPSSHWIHPLDQPRGPPMPPPPAHQPPMGTMNPQGYANYYGSQPPPPQQQAGYMNQQPMYQQQQQQVPIQAPANGRRPGGGMNPMLAGAGGLAGGMLLGSMLESHHEHHHHGDYYDNNNGYTDGYQQGYDSGYANGFDNGDDFADAGDFGGGFDDGGGFF